MAVDTALRLLELVALLFPVVALLLQLQYRAAETPEIERFGLLAGGVLLGLLAFTFLLASVALLQSGIDGGFLVVGVVLVTVVGLLLPTIVVLTRETFLDSLRTSFEAAAARVAGLRHSDGDPGED